MRPSAHIQVRVIARALRNGNLITCAFKPQAIQAIILSVGYG